MLQLRPAEWNPDRANHREANNEIAGLRVGDTGGVRRFPPWKASSASRAGNPLPCRLSLLEHFR